MQGILAFIGAFILSRIEIAIAAKEATQQAADDQ